MPTDIPSRFPPVQSPERQKKKSHANRHSFLFPATAKSRTINERFPAMTISSQLTWSWKEQHLDLRKCYEHFILDNCSFCAQRRLQKHCPFHYLKGNGRRGSIQKHFAGWMFPKVSLNLLLDVGLLFGQGGRKHDLYR